MITVTPKTPTPAWLASKGFVAYPLSTTLYTNDFYPGLLFKAVDSVAQAVAIGGYLIDNDLFQLTYLGLDAAEALAKGNLCDYSMPYSGTALVAGFMGSNVIKAPGQAQGSSLTNPSMLLHINHRLQTIIADVSAATFIGVVSRADRGFIFKHLTGTWIQIPGDVTTAELPPVYDQVTQNGTFIRSAPGGFNNYVAPGAGYIQKLFTVDKKAWLTDAKPGFLSDPSFDNPDIAAKYGKAMDILIGETSGTMVDGLHLEVTFIDGVMQCSAGRHPSTEPILFGYDGRSSFGSFFVKEGFRSTGPFYQVGDPDVDNVGVGKARFNVVNAGSGYDSVLGLPRMRTRIDAGGIVVNGGSGTDNFNPSQYLLVEAPFRLDAVPYGKVTFAKGFEIDAGNLFGFVSPRVFPAATVVPFDLSARADGDIRQLTGQFSGPPLLAITTNTTAGAAAVSAALGSEAKRREFIKTYAKDLPSYSRFIVESINRVDELALLEST